MKDKDCADCIYSGKDNVVETATVCKYPVPGWIKLRAGGAFLSGLEARDCDLYKTVEMVEAEKAAAREATLRTPEDRGNE